MGTERTNVETPLNKAALDAAVIESLVRLIPRFEQLTDLIIARAEKDVSQEEPTDPNADLRVILDGLQLQFQIELVKKSIEDIGALDRNDRDNLYEAYAG